MAEGHGRSGAGHVDGVAGKPEAGDGGGGGSGVQGAKAEKVGELLETLATPGQGRLLGDGKYMV